MRAKKIDGNQNEIVAALRRAGFSVFVTSRLGDGFPDIVVGRAGRNFLFEIKDGSLPPSKQMLTKKESLFIGNWRGQTDIITNADDAFDILLTEL